MDGPGSPVHVDDRLAVEGALGLPPAGHLQVAVEEQALPRGRHPVIDVQVQVPEMRPQDAAQEVVHAKRAVHVADQGLAALLRAGRGLARAVHGQIHEGPGLHVGLGFLHQLHLARQRGLARVPGLGHGLVADLLGEHVVPEGPFVAHGEGFQIDDRGILGAFPARPHGVVREALGPDGPHMVIQHLRGDARGKPDALDARIAVLDGQALHIGPPHAPVHLAPGRVHQPQPAAQNLLVGLHALQDAVLDVPGLELEGLALLVLDHGHGPAPGQDRGQQAQEHGRVVGQDVLLALAHGVRRGFGSACPSCGNRGRKSCPPGSTARSSRAMAVVLLSGIVRRLLSVSHAARVAGSVIRPRAARKGGA